MFELFLPFAIGMMMGITAPEPVADAARTEIAPATVAPDTATREPEPQEATGRFTTALEVKPILGVTQANWVALRDYDGQDLLYFTHLASWRCGLWEVRYGINGAPAETVFVLEPCHIETAQPNAMVETEAFPPYVAFPAGTVEAVTVEILYDDDTRESARFARGQILMPG